MSEIQIPDDLTQDCDKCQGLCCVANSHAVEEGFPREYDKPVGEPCSNLELDPTTLQGLHKCKIHGQLGRLGWNTCMNFSCYGAGQATTAFFEEMGVRWSDEKPESLNDDEWGNRIENFYFAYFVLSDVFRLLNFIKKKHGEVAFNMAKEAVRGLMPEFCKELERTDTAINYIDWLTIKFDSAVKTAIQGFTEKPLVTRVDGARPRPSFVPASRLSGRSRL